VKAAAVGLAKRNGRRVFVTLSERGILGADPNGACILEPALPVRGEIDVVGAGDSVSANLAAALAAEAALAEALALANAAASVVVHKLGTTGTASPGEIAGLLGAGAAMAELSGP
jgi:bifunctional ADP-heptose synthase (sugar kinase/adenylyltransferase)